MDDRWRTLVDRARTNQTAALALASPDTEVREWWDDAGPRAIECMSVTKFVVAIALGLAVSTDDLHVPLRTWIDEWADDARGDLTLALVLTHRTGLAAEPPTLVYETASVRSRVLASELVDAPRTFAYNNVAFHLAGIVAERAADRPLDELAATGLFGPLGIEDWSWQRDPEGFPLCMAGLHLRAPDLARIGCLQLSGGESGGRQVLPPEWLSALAPARGEVGLGCFAQFAGPADAPIRVGFGHEGYLGQWISVQPHVGAVAVRLRTTEGDDLELMWPGFPGDVRGLNPAG